jgi:hypothetical protein
MLSTPGGDMSKKLRTITAAAAVGITTALVVGGVTMASGGPDIKGPRTLRFVDRPAQQRFVDVDNSGGFSRGDMFVFTDRLRKGGSNVGTLAGACTLVGHRPVRFECEATAKLGGGKIGLQTVFRGDPGRISILVTGGTGVYRNARGQAVLDERSRPNTITFHLIP